MTDTEWTDNREEVLAFARVLVDSGLDAEGLLRFFASPHDWTPEHRRWVALGRPEYNMTSCVFDVILGDVNLSPEAEEAIDLYGLDGVPAGGMHEVGAGVDTIDELVRAGLLDPESIDIADGSGTINWTPAGRVYVAERGAS